MLEHEQLVENHRTELNKIREERRQAIQASKESAALERQALARANKEAAMRNADAIAHTRAAELNAAMFKRNEVRKVCELRSALLATIGVCVRQSSQP